MKKKNKNSKNKKGNKIYMKALWLILSLYKNMSQIIIIE